MTRILQVLAVLIVCLVLPAAAWAETDLKLKIYKSIVTGPDGTTGSGTTIDKALGSPSVSFGDNMSLGTTRITGKEGVAIPVYPGSTVKVVLPLGLCYMMTPNEENYKDYVKWPESVNGLKNQIRDVKFISGTPRSITVEVSGIDKGDIAALDFVFEKEGMSRVRVSRLVESVEEYLTNPDWYITRLEFFRLLADVVEPYAGSKTKNDVIPSPVEKFNDMHYLAKKDIRKIDLLVESGIVRGYPGGWLLPFNLITGAETVAVTRNIFKDEMYTEKFVTRKEALSLLQKLLESYGRE